MQSVECPVPACRMPFRRTGLTLIEAMLVLAILGVTLGIALPRYADYRERVNQSTAVQDIATMQAQIRLHRQSTGSYPATLDEVGSGGRLDPWGRPYVYLDLTSIQGKGKSRKDHKLNPLNSDFDLYSVGKDGLSRTQVSNKESLDDIVRALDGAYIGLAARFNP